MRVTASIGAAAGTAFYSAVAKAGNITHTTQTDMTGMEEHREIQHLSPSGASLKL
ncbi:hypothetical protein KEJ39_03745 [Candidatus Bathyarchaeota archaeon]|nr:hypothetical protein [Candidatus Bathyarchaeota archaeon]